MTAEIVQYILLLAVSAYLGACLGELLIYLSPAGFELRRLQRERDLLKKERDAAQERRDLEQERLDRMKQILEEQNLRRQREEHS